MKVCKKCNGVFEDSIEFCPKCGERLQKKGGTVKGAAVAVVVLLIVLIAGGIAFFRTRSVNEGDQTGKKEPVTEEAVQTQNNEVEAPEGELKKNLPELKGDFEDINLALGSEMAIGDSEDMIDAEWQSSKPEVVALSGGNHILAKSAGYSVITIDRGGKEASFKVTVTEPKFMVSEYSRIAGGSFDLELLGTTSQAEFISDNDAIATVDEKGHVTTQMTGIGMETNVRALVDGTEISCHVKVEPIPQLMSLYNISGVCSDGKMKLAVNADSYLKFNASPFPAEAVDPEALYYEGNDKNPLDITSGTGFDFNSERVENIDGVDYADGITFPVYYAYGEGSGSYTDIYLVGSSQEASVTVKELAYPEGGVSDLSDLEKYMVDSDTRVEYKPDEGFGTIRVYYEPDFGKYIDKENGSGLYMRGEPDIITVKIDEYTYSLAVCPVYDDLLAEVKDNDHSVKSGEVFTSSVSHVVLYDYSDKWLDYDKSSDETIRKNINSFDFSHIPDRFAVVDVKPNGSGGSGSGGSVSHATSKQKKALIDGNSTLFGTGWGYTLDEFGDKAVTALEDKAIDAITGGIVKVVLGGFLG